MTYECSIFKICTKHVCAHMHPPLHIIITIIPEKQAAKNSNITNSFK